MELLIIGFIPSALLSVYAAMIVARAVEFFQARGKCLDIVFNIEKDAGVQRGARYIKDDREMYQVIWSKSIDPSNSPPAVQMLSSLRSLKKSGHSEAYNIVYKVTGDMKKTFDEIYNGSMAKLEDTDDERILTSMRDKKVDWADRLESMSPSIKALFTILRLNI